LLKTSPEQATKKIEQLTDKVKGQEKEILVLKQKLAGQSSGDLGDSAMSVGDIKVVSQSIEGADIAALRGTMDKLKDRLPQSVIVLATVEDGKVRIIAGVSKSLTKRMAAGDLVNFVAKQVDGKGGGRPDMAQAGGNDPSKLGQALGSVVGWVTERVG
jgi:alanyl-tRNA synthetase